MNEAGVRRMGALASWYETRLFHPLMDRALSAPAVVELRRELLAHAGGEVVEVGVGTGLNLPHYPADVKRVRVVAREARLDRRVDERARAAAIEVEHVVGDAQRLPLEDRSIDALVCTFVLCSVDDPRRACLEFARVLRPGGVLIVAEHVRSPRAFERSLQRMLTPLHRHWACGCRLDRELAADLATAGFDVAGATGRRADVLPFPASELVCGALRSRADASR